MGFFFFNGGCFFGGAAFFDGIVLALWTGFDAGGVGFFDLKLFVVNLVQDINEAVCADFVLIKGNFHGIFLAVALEIKFAGLNGVGIHQLFSDTAATAFFAHHTLDFGVQHLVCFHFVGLDKNVGFLLFGLNYLTLSAVITRKNSR